MRHRSYLALLRAAVIASGLQTLAITDLHAELAASFGWSIVIPWARRSNAAEAYALLAPPLYYKAILSWKNPQLPLEW